MHTKPILTMLLVASTSLLAEDAAPLSPAPLALSAKDAAPLSPAPLALSAKDAAPLSPAPTALPAPASTTAPPKSGETSAKNWSLEAKEKRQEKDSAPVTPGQALGKTCLGLGVILALIAALTWALRRWGRRLGVAPGQGEMRINGRITLDAKNSLILVRVHEEELLLAVGPNGTTSLARYALIDHENDLPSVGDGKRQRLPLDGPGSSERRDEEM